MAKRSKTKPSRKQRKSRRAQNQRAEAHGLPQKPVPDPRSKRTGSAADGGSTSRRRGGRAQAEDGAPDSDDRGVVEAGLWKKITDAPPWLKLAGIAVAVFAAMMIGLEYGVEKKPVRMIPASATAEPSPAPTAGPAPTPVPVAPAPEPVPAIATEAGAPEAPIAAEPVSEPTPPVAAKAPPAAAKAPPAAAKAPPAAPKAPPAAAKAPPAAPKPAAPPKAPAPGGDNPY